MSDDPCHEMRLLIQADVDGELQPVDSARVAAHIETCPACAGLQRQLIALSGDLREKVPRHRAPEQLRDAMRKRVASQRVHRPPPPRRWPMTGAALGALAASLALFILLPNQEGGTGSMPDWVVAAHIRALQPQHLLDVVSTEQHTVKPWFAGRLPFAPPVKDLASDGFPLAGARLDYLPGSTAATLVYKRRDHIIDLFIWITADDEVQAGADGSREGYNFVRWSADGMTFWAVSDLNPKELGEFAARWRQ